MPDNIKYEGEILIINVTAQKLGKLNKYLGKDARNLGLRPDVIGFHHFDVEFNEDLTGLRWNGSEGTRNMVGILTYLQNECDLTLTGKMLCQGPEFGDRYAIIISNGTPVKIDVALSSEANLCPSCGHQWMQEG